MLMRYALFWGITQYRVVILYRHVGKTYRFHLPVSRSPEGLTQIRTFWRKLLVFTFKVQNSSTVQTEDT
jgi:hypothetical protein